MRLVQTLSRLNICTRAHTITAVGEPELCNQRDEQPCLIHILDPQLEMNATLSSPSTRHLFSAVVCSTCANCGLQSGGGSTGPRTSSSRTRCAGLPFLGSSPLAPAPLHLSAFYSPPPISLFFFRSLSAHLSLSSLSPLLSRRLSYHHLPLLPLAPLSHLSRPLVPETATLLMLTPSEETKIVFALLSSIDAPAKWQGEAIE